MNHWLAIAIAIVAEVTATNALKASNEFTRLWPSLIVVAGYGVAFYATDGCTFTPSLCPILGRLIRINLM